MTRHELRVLFNNYLKYYWRKDWTWADFSLKASFYKSDRQLRAYLRWAPTEIKSIISSLSTSVDKKYKDDCDIDELDTDYDALYEFEMRITEIGDWIEIFNQTHGYREINPFEVLIDLAQGFVDYAYRY